MLNTQAIAGGFLPKSSTTLQFFQWDDNVVLAGMSQVLEFFEKNTATHRYQIRYLPDGKLLKARQVVLELVGLTTSWVLWGRYWRDFIALLFSATNARRCVKAAQGKELIFMVTEPIFT
ncbi:hypothetical protein [Mycoplasma sp. ATU-Cv-508]|uniref:hypothetical protein n=1 Tax=Mycoplasma sp. ATU-Cv-508 TaxID=2048001 RepID=UPI000FDEA140